MLLTIQMYYLCGNTGNGLHKCDLHVIMQICTSPFEYLMLLDLYSYIHISGHDTWQLITLTMENVVVLMWNSGLYNHLQSLLLLFYFFTITAFTFSLLSYLLTTTSTFLATGLSLSIHSRTQLHQFNSDSITFAITTFFNFTSSFSITISTHSVPRHFYLFFSTQKYLFQSNIKFDQLWLHFLWFVVRLSPLEEVKYVRAHSWWSTILNSLLSILVVELSFFWVKKCIICFFELFKPFGVTTFVGMLFKRFLPKSLLDLLSSCVFCYLQQLIVLCIINLFLLLCLLSSRLILPIPLLLLIPISPKKHNSTIY